MINFASADRFVLQLMKYFVSSLKSDPHLPEKIWIICFIDSPLKMMKNAFYFILKALFVLKIFRFGHV